MSLRVRLIAVIGFLSAILLFGSIWEGSIAFQQLNKTSHALKTENIASVMIKAERSMAVERGVTQGIIGSGRFSEKQVATIRERRTIVRSILAQINQNRIASDPRFSEQLETVNSLHDQIETARTAFDGFFDEDQRVTHEIKTTWFSTATQLIRALATLRGDMEVAAQPDAQIAPFVDVRDRISSLTELLGQERGRLNGYVAAGKPIYPNDLVPLRLITGMIYVRLSDVETMAKKLPPEYNAQVLGALENYKTKVEVERDKLIEDGQVGRDYHLNTDDWFAFSTGGILEFFKVADQMGESITLYTTEQYEQRQWVSYLSVGLVVLSLLAIGFAIYVTQFQIQKPLSNMLRIMDDLQNAKFETDIPTTCTSTEMSTMYQALDRFRLAGLENETFKAEQEENKRKSEEQQRVILMKVADEFEAAIGKVTNDVVASAQQLVASASTVKSQADLSASRGKVVQEQAIDTETNVQTVADAARDLEKAIEEISQKTNLVAHEANEANGLADVAAKRVDDLNGMSEQIQDVILIITSIAEQTNLLALNATIEAARAGEAGKGFAVVASEVKNLATQTQKATSEISTHIHGMLSQITETTEDVGKILGSISSMRDNVTAVADLTREQSSTTRNIAVSISSASERTGQVRGEVSTMAQSAEETNTAIDQVAQSAQQLSSLGDQLEQESSLFLEKVRA